MYSNNDYRYYLEHQLMESDDFLAHYGVKGMTWKNHNYVIDPRLRERMAKGLGVKRPRGASNPMLQRRNGVTSRINAAKRRAQLGTAKRLMKSKTGRKVLMKGAQFEARNRVNSAKKSFKRAGTSADDWRKQQMKKAQRIAKNAKRQISGAHTEASMRDAQKAVKRTVNKAKFKAAKGALKSKTGRKVLKAYGKHKVNQSVNSAKQKANNAYNSARPQVERAAHKVKTQSKSTALKTRDKIQPIAKKAKTQAKSTALKTRDKVQPAAHKAKTQAKSTALKTRDKVQSSSAYKKASKAAKGVRSETKKAYNSTKSDAKRVANSAKRKASSTAKNVRNETRKAYKSTKSDAKRTANNVRRKAQNARKRANSAATQTRNKVSARRAIRRTNNRNW